MKTSFYNILLLELAIGSLIVVSRLVDELEEVFLRDQPHKLSLSENKNLATAQFSEHLKN